jgi:hypothetical protein
MKSLESFVEANPILFRQEELILDVTELIAGVMVQAQITTPALSTKLNKPTAFVTRHLAGEEEISLRPLADIFGALGYRVRISAEPIAGCIDGEGIPSAKDGKAQPTWVPCYVERAICDLIPDTGHAREIARCAWKWDDEHPAATNALYRWQNEAIRQRRDLIALQGQVALESSMDGGVDDLGGTNFDDVDDY